MQRRINVPLAYLSRTGVETSFGYLGEDTLALVVLHAIKHVTEEEMCSLLENVPENAGGRDITINVEAIDNMGLKDIIDAYEVHLEQMVKMKKKPVLDNPYAQLRKVIYYNWCNWPMFNMSKYETDDPILYNSDISRRVNAEYNCIRQIMKRTRHTSKGADAQSKWMDFCETMLKNGGNETSIEFRKAAIEYWNNECKNKSIDPTVILLETAYGKYNGTTLRQKARGIVNRHPEYNEYGDYQTTEGRIAIVKAFDQDRGEKEKAKLIKYIDKHKIV